MYFSPDRCISCRRLNDYNMTRFGDFWIHDDCYDREIKKLIYDPDSRVDSYFDTEEFEELDRAWTSLEKTDNDAELAKEFAGTRASDWKRRRDRDYADAKAKLDQQILQEVQYYEEKRAEREAEADEKAIQKMMDDAYKKAERELKEEDRRKERRDREAKVEAEKRAKLDAQAAKERAEQEAKQAEIEKWRPREFKL